MSEELLHKKLSDSILLQYGYLEHLIEICKHEKDPDLAPSQLIIRGKDPEYNKGIQETRKQVKKLLKMAENALE